MNDLKKRALKLLAAYKKKFGESIIYPEDLPVGTFEEWLNDIQRCLDTDTPYIYPESDLPNDCIS